MKLFYFLTLFILHFTILNAQNQHRDINVYFDTAVYELNEDDKLRVRTYLDGTGCELILE